MNKKVIIMVSAMIVAGATTAMGAKDSKIRVPLNQINCDVIWNNDKCEVITNDCTNDAIPKPPNDENVGDNENNNENNDNNTNNEQTTIGYEVLNLVNKERAALGLSKLSYSKSLETVAYNHSRDMSVNNYFSHDSKDGKTPFDRLKNAGISYNYAAENIASGQKDAQAVVNSWMNSAPHRKNILNPNLKEMGLGYYKGVSNKPFYTQLFIG